MTAQSSNLHPCLFDPWKPCENIKQYSKLCDLDPPACEHIRKIMLKPGDIEFYVMMDSNCHNATPHCSKPEASHLRMLATWDTTISRHNNKYKKLTCDLKSLEGDALSFPDGHQDGGHSVRESVPLYVFPNYPKAAQYRCANKTLDVTKKSESALRRVPVAVQVRVWKDELNIGSRTQEFMVEVALPPEAASSPAVPAVTTTPPLPAAVNSGPRATGPIKIFISYANEDSRIKEALIRDLRPLQDAGLISHWHDREILPGKDWSVEIDSHLNSARIILLLVSLDFIASPYITSVELKRALERHDRGEARVIPIIIRHSDWQLTKLAKLQALPPGALPIKDYTDEDKWFTEVKTGLREVIKELSQPDD